MGLSPLELQRLLFPRSSSSFFASSPSSSSAAAAADVAAFRDLHTSVYPSAAKSPGLTFPTFQDHRVADPCRPDRILMRQHMQRAADSSPPSLELLECDVGVFLHRPLATEPPTTLAFASDHRGVAAVLVWMDISEEAETLEQQLSRAQSWKQLLVAPASPPSHPPPPPLPLPVVELVLPVTLSSSLSPYQTHVLGYMLDGRVAIDDHNYFWTDTAPQQGAWIHVDFRSTLAAAPLPLDALRSLALLTGRRPDKPVAAAATTEPAALGDTLPPDGTAVLDLVLAVPDGLSPQAWNALWLRRNEDLGARDSGTRTNATVLAPAHDTADSSPALVAWTVALTQDHERTPGRLQAHQRQIDTIMQLYAEQPHRQASDAPTPPPLHSLRIRFVQTMQTWLAVREIELSL